MKFLLRLFLVFFALSLPLNLQAEGHRVLILAKGELKVFEKDGSVSWSTPWGGTHDIHVDSDGFYYAIKGNKKVCKIDPAMKKIVWEYDSSKSNDNNGKKVEVHAFQVLEDGRFMIAESGAGRIIEIDEDGKLHKEIKLKVNNPHPHTDTRLARKIANGNYLAAHEGDGFAREYDGETGKVIWEYEVPKDEKRKSAGGHGLDSYGNKLFSATRLKNGNTLIGGGNNHTVLEVTPDKKIVWSLSQYELEGIGLSWVTTVEALDNGNIVIGNCHAGPKNPQLVEIDRKTKKVVWTLNQFDKIGNNASNSILLDQVGTSLR